MKRFLPLVFFSVVAHAEVMDKEPSGGFLLLLTIASSALAFLFARRVPWLLVFLLPLAGVYFLAVGVETLDPAIGAAIKHESGSHYLMLPWVGIGGTVAGCVLGWWRRRYTHLKQPNSPRAL